ncbi:Uu.00g058840.m01.CDS01 [Anthostomella pinea]|uniref:SWR1-complex protein 5 n=1 Tax=Anthostomella pinea TaxID=933095 RepID=A0AAI8VSL1_9PEZI|nr:Uu.00g058840.m01.CDS01 [Anthostomella pinea]
MPPDPIIDEDYASEEDSDFAPDAPAEGASDASDSEGDGDELAAAPKRKRTVEDDAADDGYENSGDEAIISKGKKRQKKASKIKDGGVAEDDDEGGEGGLVKTRSMRAVEKAERKSHAVTGPITVDVDDIWAQMTSGPLLPSKKKDAEQEQENQRPAEEGATEGVLAKDADKIQTHPEKPGESSEPSAMIKIKRTYNFAGKVHTEEKLVPRDSAEAKLYLASLDPKAIEEVTTNEDEEPKRKPRKAFRSIFEPIIEGLGQRIDLNLGMSVRLQLREQQAKAGNAKKLNVVEKSRMDWAGFVDKEGIQDELKLAGKSKESYAHRQDFLARVEAKKDEEARRVRIAGRG